jgi:hypothetical protein
MTGGDPQLAVDSYKSGLGGGMDVDVHRVVAEELGRRGISATREPRSGRLSLNIHGVDFLINLCNLQRDVASDGDVGRVARFVDAIFASRPGAFDDLSRERFCWCLEPSSHKDRAEFRVPLSDDLDRVLVHVSVDGTRITWVVKAMLDAWNCQRIARGRHGSWKRPGFRSTTSMAFRSLTSIRV